jgi:oxygen-independent coproporphyrinogen III oxidase
LRLNRGVDPSEMAEQYGIDAIEKYRDVLVELESDGLLELDEGSIRLSERGRLLSNTVFEKFLVGGAPSNAERGNAELRITNAELKPSALKVLK